MDRKDGIRLYPLLDFVADMAKCGQTFLRRPRCGGRIRESSVQPFRSAGEYRACLASAIANRDHKIEVSPQQGIYMFGLICRNIDADFSHGRNGVRMDSPWVRAGAACLPLLPMYGAKQTFGHLGAAGIMGA